jgi:hypothetical protein
MDLGCYSASTCVLLVALYTSAYTIAGPEFAASGEKLIIVRALYGLKVVERCGTYNSVENLRDMGYRPTKAEIMIVNP